MATADRRGLTRRPAKRANGLAQGHGEAFECSRIPPCDQPRDLGVDRDEIIALPCSTTTVPYRACFRARYGKPTNVFARTDALDRVAERSVRALGLKSIDRIRSRFGLYRPAPDAVGNPIK
jgi:hypothetical protein